MKTYLLSKSEFQQFQSAFRALANSKCLSSDDILLYNLIRGLPLDRGFSPVTNSNKLNNGWAAMHSFNDAKHLAKFHLQRRFAKWNPSDSMKARYGLELTDEQLNDLAGKL